MNRDPIRTKRKVQQLGSSTLGVTVPADWVRHHDIEKGDELIMQRDESGGSLLLVPEDPTIDDEAATVDADALEADAVERAVVTQYVLGRQLIHVSGSEPLTDGQRNGVRSAERRLMGLGIVEERADEITVRCSIAPTDFELGTLLGRLFRTEATMREDALTALTTGDAATAERVRDRESQIEKLFYLFLRIVFATYRNPRLNRAVGLDTGFPLIGYRSAAQDIVLMADAAIELADIVRDYDVAEPDAETRSRLETLGEALEAAATATRSAITAPDYGTTCEARAALSALEDEVDAVNAYLREERPEPLLALQRGVDMLERSSRHTRDTLSVATHLAFREDADLVTHD
jgi:phosphate uptake regulator